MRHKLQPPLHGQGTDVPPASIQPPGGLLDGVTLSLCGAGVTVMEKDLTQVQHGCHSGAVFLDVPLQLLEIIKNY